MFSTDWGIFLGLLAFIAIGVVASWRLTFDKSVDHYDGKRAGNDFAGQRPADND